MANNKFFDNSINTKYIVSISFILMRYHYYITVHSHILPKEI